MTHTDRPLRLAVIGAGPRALGALEALATGGLRGRRLEIAVFDGGARAGSGPNFDPSSAPVELLNLPVRALDLPKAVAPLADFPDFQDWLSRNGHACAADDYPPRALLGGYLRDRWEHLAATLRDAGHKLLVHESSVCRLSPCSRGWMVEGAAGRTGPVDEVLLVAGQPRTRPDAQLRRWTAHAVRHGLTLLPVYPTDDLHRAVPDWRGRTVAIRGLGLSTFDALRALTLGRGGRFEDGRYIASGREPQRIVPFSLDGRPPAPKPATAAIDDAYKPSTADCARFREALAACCAGAGDTSLDPLIACLADMASGTLRRLGGDPHLDPPRRWLDAEVEHPGQQESQSALEFLDATMAMASGEEPPSTGYAIGQIWRRLQTDLRAEFHAQAPAAPVARALVALDEGLKRYSYGPPLTAAQELRALVRAGIVTLRATADPDIELTPGGWGLDAAGGRAFRADVMLDAVLPGPDLSRLSEPLIVDLLEAGVLAAMGEGLGLDCDRQGQARDDTGQRVRGLSVLGRLCIGRVIAVDSIHDCFGPATRAWADRLLDG
jgi:uncharacterized NAD(P)/FAD-binding protein YdhS